MKGSPRLWEPDGFRRKPKQALGQSEKGAAGLPRPSFVSQFLIWDRDPFRGRAPEIVRRHGNCCSTPNLCLVPDETQVVVRAPIGELAAVRPPVVPAGMDAIRCCDRPAPAASLCGPAVWPASESCDHSMTAKETAQGKVLAVP